MPGVRKEQIVNDQLENSVGSECAEERLRLAGKNSVLERELS